jgi:uncharacterized membrane protein
MEPEWTKRISSETVCNFFYAFFVVYAILAVVSVVGLVGILSTAKLPKGIMVAQTFYGLIMIALATTMALFHYLICDRALKPGAGKEVKGVRPAPESNPNMVAY